MKRSLAVLNAVHERLRVLDAHAERERLRFERDTGVEQELEHVASGMARREHDRIGAELAAVAQAHGLRCGVRLILVLRRVR